MGETKWLTAREQSVWRAFMRTNRDLTSAIERDLSSGFGISGPDFMVLVALSEADEGRLRIGELARELGWERSRMSHQVRRMADRRLVCRMECGSDARGTYVQLTGEGREMIENAAPAHVNTVRACFFDVLERTDLASLERIAAKVAAAVAARR